MSPKHKVGWAVVKGMHMQAPEIGYSSFTPAYTILNQLEAHLHSLRESEARDRGEWMSVDIVSRRAHVR